MNRTVYTGALGTLGHTDLIFGKDAEVERDAIVLQFDQIELRRTVRTVWTDALGTPGHTVTC